MIPFLRIILNLPGFRHIKTLYVWLRDRLTNKYAPLTDGEVPPSETLGEHIHRTHPQSSVGDACWQQLFMHLDEEGELSNLKSINRELLGALAQVYPLSPRHVFRVTGSAELQHITTDGGLTAHDAIRQVITRVG